MLRDRADDFLAKRRIREELRTFLAASKYEDKLCEGPGLRAPDHNKVILLTF